jgi:serine O-acetyltransferase
LQQVDSLNVDEPEVLLKDVQPFKEVPLSMPSNPASNSTSTFQRLGDVASILFGMPLLALFALSANRNTIGMDTKRWLTVTNSRLAGIWGMAYLLGRLPEFRSLFYYRLGVFWKPATLLCQLVYPRCPALYLYSDSIGPGLFIQHGFATIVSARSIGSNCWINQQVTIGFSDSHNQPTIGNNVTIHCGAIIIGGVSIGDNAVIGAGAVIVRDVPPDSVMVGVPARVIRRNGVRCNDDEFSIQQRRDSERELGFLSGDCRVLLP